MTYKFFLSKAAANLPTLCLENTKIALDIFKKSTWPRQKGMGLTEARQKFAAVETFVEQLLFILSNFSYVIRIWLLYLLSLSKKLCVPTLCSKMLIAKDFPNIAASNVRHKVSKTTRIKASFPVPNHWTNQNTRRKANHCRFVTMWGGRGWNVYHKVILLFSGQRGSENPFEKVV